eukprot:scaffold4582_cov202-Prasinococcus_capsulatus_cf.AAC.3
MWDRVQHIEPLHHHEASALTLGESPPQTPVRRPPRGRSSASPALACSRAHPRAQLALCSRMMSERVLVGSYKCVLS